MGPAAQAHARARSFITKDSGQTRQHKCTVRPAMLLTNVSCAFSRKRVVVGHANLRDEVLPVELCIGTVTGLGRSDTGTSSFVHHQGSHTSATGGLEADLCLYLSHLVAFSRAGNGTVWNGTTPGKEVHAATITHARFGVHYLGERSHATWSSV